VKRRTKNIIAFVVFVALCIVPITLVVFWSYMVASGRTARKVEQWLESQLDLQLEISSITQQVGSRKSARGVTVFDYRGEQKIFHADSVELSKDEDGLPVFTISDCQVNLDNDATAADVLAGVNKLLRTTGLKRLSLVFTGAKLAGALPASFDELTGSVEADGKNIKISLNGSGRDVDGRALNLKLIDANLKGRSLEYDLEISREGKAFIAESLKPMGAMLSSFVRDFKGNQVKIITNKGFEERFKQGYFSLDLRAFYRAAGLEKDYFNSFDQSFITEIKIGQDKLGMFEVRINASPGANDRKVISRRFLYTAMYLLTGKYLLIPRDRDEYPFTEMSFDVQLSEGLYTVKGLVSRDGQWVLLDKIALNAQISIPAADVTIEPADLAKRWTEAKDYNRKGWPQESLPETTAESLQQLLELAGKSDAGK